MERFIKGMQSTSRISSLLELLLSLTKRTAICVPILCACLVMPALAGVEDNAVLALDPAAGMVVVKTAAGSLEVIGVGEPFPGSEVVVRQVLGDRVIAEEIVGEENPVRQQVWVYKANAGESVSRVERLLLEAPQSGTLAPDRVQLVSPAGEAGNRATGQ